MIVSRLVGERGVSQWRLDAGVLQPVPSPEPLAAWASWEREGGEPSAVQQCSRDGLKMAVAKRGEPWSHGS